MVTGYSLWPDDIVDSYNIASPGEILRNQASLLGKRTRNLVEAEVRCMYDQKWCPSLESHLSGEFVYVFYLVARTIGYQFRLFSMRYDARPYPVSILLDEDIEAQIVDSPSGQPITITTEHELVDLLRRIFASQKTRRIINALYSQMTA